MITDKTRRYIDLSINPRINNVESDIEAINTALASASITSKAAWQITASATTIVSAVDTPTLVGGTTTLVGSPTNFTMPSSNVLQYTGIEEVHISIDGMFELSSGNNNIIKIYARKYVNATISYEDLVFYALVETDGTGAIKNTCMHSQATLNQNDRIEIWCENITAGTDITFAIGGQLIIRQI